MKKKSKKTVKNEVKQEVKQNNNNDILIQVGLALYFTVYFVAHHFLGVYNTRWILYIGFALMVLYAIKTKTKKDKKFSEGFNFNKVFILYVIGCMIGTYYEEILTFFRTNTWVSRQGIIYGPFNPVYGVGFFLFTVLLCRNLKRKWYITYFYSCLLGGLTECALSMVSEYVFKVNAWDYSGMFLNILGRTTVPYMLFWGLGGLAFVKLVYPAFSALIEKLPARIGNKIMPTFMVFVIISHIFSYSALFRYGTRSEGKEATNVVEKVLDKYYPDEIMKEYYENSVHETIGGGEK